MQILRLIAIVVLGAITVNATAEVTDVGANGFTLVHEVNVSSSRADAWAAAVHDVGLWWNPAHTISGNAELLSIDARPLGCFCEAAGGGVVHLTVTWVSRNAILRMSGGLGPLGLMGVNGNMTWEFSDDGGGTKIILASAPVASTASFIVLNTGRSRCLLPPLPGVTPPTTLVPYLIMSVAWKVPI